VTRNQLHQPCPRRELLAHTVKMSSVFTSARPNIILYAKTKSPARIRLNSRLSRPTLTRRWWYVSLLMPRSRFVKRLCTFSSAVISFKRNGFHTTLQYSKIDLTYTVKALTNDDKSRDMLLWVRRLLSHGIYAAAEADDE